MAHNDPNPLHHSYSYSDDYVHSLREENETLRAEVERLTKLAYFIVPIPKFLVRRKAR